MISSTDSSSNNIYKSTITSPFFHDQHHHRRRRCMLHSMFPFSSLTLLCSSHCCTPDITYTLARHFNPTTVHILHASSPLIIMAHKEHINNRNNKSSRGWSLKSVSVVGWQHSARRTGKLSQRDMTCFCFFFHFNILLFESLMLIYNNAYVVVRVFSVYFLCSRRLKCNILSREKY